MAKKTTVVTKEEIDSEAAEDESQEGDEQYAPLFDDLDRSSKKIDKVHLRRTDPDSGFLGQLAATVTEHEIFSRWGGGTYRLEAKNEMGRLAKVRTVKIAGDPLFESEAEERRWRKQNGLGDKQAAHAESGMKISDMLLLIEEKEEKRRTEMLEREERNRREQLEREEKERKFREDREMQLQRDRDNREERLRKDAEEREDRRRREAKEDEERRARLHREDMERIAAQSASQLQQAQTFFTQLATTMQANANATEKSDPVATLLSGMQIAREMGAGGAPAEPGDFLSSLMSRLPETLSELRKTGAAAYSELAGRQAGKPSGVGKEEDFLTIKGPTATRVKQVLGRLVAQGKNPEAEINKMLLMAAAGTTPAAPGVALVKGKAKSKGKPNGKRPTSVRTAATKPAVSKRGRRSTVPGGASRRVGKQVRDSTPARNRNSRPPAALRVAPAPFVAEDPDTRAS